VSERDREYIDAIKAHFKDAVSNDKPPRPKLTNEIIASFFTSNGEQLNERKLNRKLKKEEHFFNVSNLIILKKGVGNYINGSNFAYTVTVFIGQLCIAQMIDEGIDIYELIRDAQSYDETIKLFLASAQSVFINVSFEDGVSEIISQSDLKQTLQVLLSSPCAIPQLNITVCKSDTESTIKIIKDWAYGKDGNFTNRLEVNVFERRYSPLQTISGVVDGELVAYIAHGDNYYAMSDMAKGMVQEDMNAMMTETAIWSLPKSPEVRILKRMRRELDNQDLPPEIFNLLLDTVRAVYEDTEQCENSNVYGRLSNLILPLVLDNNVANGVEAYFEIKILTA
jgi:hypothetical protein